MSNKFKQKVGANQRPLIGGREYKPPADPPNLAAKFIRENRDGIPDIDEGAQTLGGEPVSAVETPAPVAAVETPPTPSTPPVATDAPAAETPDPATPPVETPVVVGEATGGSGDPPPIATPAATVETSVAAPVAEPPRDKYDKSESISLLDGEPEWTREQIILGLQERANLQAAATERDQLLQGLGARDVKTAMGFVEPFVKAIRENPDRAKLLDTVAGMDPATLNYMGQVLENWKQLPVEERQQFGVIGQAGPQQQPTDPRYDELARNQQAIELRLLDERKDRELSALDRDWPFARRDERTWKSLKDLADMLWQEDGSKGIPPLQRRGLVEAVEQLRPFLENMKANQERRVMQHASAAAAPPQHLGAPPAASAILPTTHPQPPVAARPPRKEYRGPVDGAAAAFLADQGYTK